MKNKSKSRQDAFSLLELLTVVVILGVLAAAIAPRIITSTADARTTVHEHNLGEINAAVDRFHYDNGTFPAGITDLTPTYLPSGVPDVPTDATLEYALDGDNRATTQPK